MLAIVLYVLSIYLLICVWWISMQFCEDNDWFGSRLICGIGIGFTFGMCLEIDNNIFRSFGVSDKVITATMIAAMIYIVIRFIIRHFSEEE